MDWLLRFLLGAWWYGDDGRTKTADAADRFLLPVIALIGVGAVGALLGYMALR